MFNVGGAEILVIALIALIAVGPEQLPGVMRKVGGYVAQIRSMTSGLRDEFMSSVDEVDPAKWTGDGSDDRPIIPRGYAENNFGTAGLPRGGPPQKSTPDDPSEDETSTAPRGAPDREETPGVIDKTTNETTDDTTDDTTDETTEARPAGEDG